MQHKNLPVNTIQELLIWTRLRNAVDPIGDDFSVILERGDGMLQHEDTTLLRRARLAIVFADDLRLRYGNQENSFRITSDGMNVKIEMVYN